MLRSGVHLHKCAYVNHVCSRTVERETDVTQEAILFPGRNRSLPGDNLGCVSAAYRRAMGAVAWEPVCRADELEFERGVSALVHGQSIAIFRTASDDIFALGNHDPFARGSVLARAIVGLRRGIPFVGSPVHKHAFDCGPACASRSRRSACRRTR